MQVGCGESGEFSEDAVVVGDAEHAAGAAVAAQAGETEIASAANT